MPEGMQFAKMNRRQLQSMAKQYGIKANLSSGEIIRQLSCLRNHTGTTETAQDPQKEEPENDIQKPAQSICDDIETTSAYAEDDEERRDSLEDELAKFSPPKTTSLLPPTPSATPRSKSRSSLGMTLNKTLCVNESTVKVFTVAPLQIVVDTPSEQVDTPSEQEASIDLGGTLGLCKEGGGVVTKGIYGAPQASSSVANPWTPLKSDPATTPSKEITHSELKDHAEQNKGGTKSFGKSSSILESAEYWRLRAERSERKRQRFEISSDIITSSVPESTQSFCKRIATMCLEVQHSVTPHKLKIAASMGPSSNCRPLAPAQCEQSRQYGIEVSDDHDMHGALSPPKCSVCTSS
jgi:hypothetical protein